MYSITDAHHRDISKPADPKGLSKSKSNSSAFDVSTADRDDDSLSEYESDDDTVPVRRVTRSASAAPTQDRVRSLSVCTTKSNRCPVSIIPPSTTATCDPPLSPLTATGDAMSRMAVMLQRDCRYKGIKFADVDDSTNTIVAPNVGRLSKSSTIVIELISSTGEKIAVQCSVDVLKMRSEFFHDLLRDQESDDCSDQSTTNSFMTSERGDNNSRGNNRSLSIPEQSPFEAAAYLESLHDGRSCIKTEWSYCWARLRCARL